MAESFMSRPIDVVTVTPATIARFGGLPWAEVIASDLPRQRVSYGAVQERPQEGKAWLREVDGSAFLYLQNW